MIVGSKGAWILGFTKIVLGKTDFFKKIKMILLYLKVSSMLRIITHYTVFPVIVTAEG